MSRLINKPQSFGDVSHNYKSLSAVRNALEDMAREQGKPKWFFEDGITLSCLLKHVIGQKKQLDQAFLDVAEELNLSLS